MMNHHQLKKNEQHELPSSIDVDKFSTTGVNDFPSSNHQTSPSFRLDLQGSSSPTIKSSAQLRIQADHFLLNPPDHYPRTDLNYPKGIEPLSPPNITYNCVFVPIFVAAWWYWTKRKTRQVFVRVGLLTESPEEDELPNAIPTRPDDRGSSNSRHNNKRNNVKHHKIFGTTKGDEEFNTFPNNNSNSFEDEAEYSSWEEVVQAHDKAMGKDPSIRFVRWIKRGAADYTDAGFGNFSGSVKSSSSCSAASSSVASVKQATKRTLFSLRSTQHGSTSSHTPSSANKVSKRYYNNYWQLRRHNQHHNLASKTSSASSTELLENNHKALKSERLQSFPLFNKEMTNKEEEVNDSGNDQTEVKENTEELQNHPKYVQEDEVQEEADEVSDVYNRDIPLSIQIT
mmetsp:Transcript_18483/g.26088  ORF Transcript_18483/g.26088 Transcript_18483/m.26088 type:complete len:398 (-) Transcript_18483:150-1343(-)